MTKQDQITLNIHLYLNEIEVQRKQIKEEEAVRKAASSSWWEKHREWKKKNNIK